MSGQHKHRWKIAPANGPTSKGVCACGEEREFRNSAKDYASGRWSPVKAAKERVHA